MAELKPIVKYSLELVVITASVLLAFWLENIREDLQEEKARKEAIYNLIAEIRYNIGVLNESYHTVKHFNEHAHLTDSLRRLYKQDTLFINESELNLIKIKYPENLRIQRMGTKLEGGRYKVDLELTVDFFLNRPNFGVWYSLQNSGILLGLDKESIAALFDLYNSFETDFGYGQDDYHKALIRARGEFGDIDGILSATYKLEQSLNFKLIIVNSRLDHTLDLLSSRVAD